MGKQDRQDRHSAEPQVPARYLLVVLGMHRSGTSALGGVLHHLGCGMPQSPMPPNENNPKGYFESLKVYQLNDEILRTVKSSWLDWREISPAWFASAQGQAYLLRARDVLTHEFGETPLGVLKDPRICRMVPFWAEAARLAGFRFLPILTHRNPLEVAKSLQTRDGIDASEGMLVWLRHVLDAEAGTRGMRRCATSYTAVLRNWVRQVAAIQDSLDVILPQFDDRSSMEIENFLSRGLRHFDEVPEKVLENPTLSVWLRDTYAILERWLDGPENKADHKRLDRIRAEFNAAVPAFGQLIGGPGETRFSLLAEVEAARQDLAAATTRATEAEAREAEVSQRIDAARQQREALQAKLSGAETRAADLSSQVEAEALRQGALRQELDGALGQLKGAAAERTEMRAELERKDALLREFEAERQSLRDALSQAQSALAQRGLEAEQGAERARLAEEERDAGRARIATLEQALSSLQDDAESALSEVRKAHRGQLAEETGRWRGKTEAMAAELAEMRSAAARSQGLLGELRAQVAAVSTDRAGIAATSQARAVQLAELEAVRAAQLQKIDRLAAEIEALRGSTSWRLTWPLRKLVNLLRGNG